ncbi:MAG: outer membrane protein [Gammaproteobacteria bacterium]
MLNTFRILFLLILFVPVFCSAETNTNTDANGEPNADKMLIDVNLLFSVPDAGGNDNFHTGKTLLVNYNYYFKSWLIVTGGVFVSEKISTNPASDVVSIHQETIQSRGITFGVRSEHKFSKRNKIYGRLGLLYYASKLTVDEYFDSGIPVGSVSDTTDGYGYYAAMAWAHSFTRQVSLQLELYTMAQLDLFKDKSTTPFDLKNTGISIGVGYAF